MAGNNSILQTFLDLLVALEAAMKNHYANFLTSIDTQRPVVERMRILAQRQGILAKGVPEKRTYPMEACPHVEDDIRADFYARRSLINDSNTRLESSLADIKEKYSGLNDCMKNMDENSISSLKKSDNARPPGLYFVEIFGDFLKFFTKAQSQLNCLSSFLHADNVSSVNSYRKQLDINMDFKDHFGKSLAYCSSLHGKSNT